MADGLGGRRKRGLTRAKAQEIEHDKGFTRLGDGYDSPKQERFIHLVAHGTPTRVKTRSRKRGKR